VHPRSFLIGVVGCLATLSVTQVFAEVILPSLPAGSQYQLVFVTAGTRDATSSNISDYNAFVTQQAALGTSLPSGATWHAIGSTTAIDAIDNAPTYDTIPIYNTNGQLIASGKTDLWDGTVQNYINFDQYGNQATSSNRYPWTGTLWNGHAVSTNELGTTVGDMNSWYGWTGNTGAGVGYWVKYSYAATSYAGSFYALSSPITVPEPSTIALLTTAAASLLFTVWRRRKRS
jgi:hypothetical protein